MIRPIREYWNDRVVRRGRATHMAGILVVLGIIVVGLIFLLGLFLVR